MAIYFCSKTRRQFLIGSGKTLLALPLLPSLLPRVAMGQSQQGPRRTMIFWYDHNNLNAMWPSPRMATTSVGSSGAREVSLRSLGSVASHSPALNHPRYESIKNANLLTYVRGLDIEHGAGHGNGGLAAGQDRESQGGYPTIDTVIEVCPSVYPSTTPISVRRALRISPQTGGDFYRKVGNSVERVGFYQQNSMSQFYNDVFGSLTEGTAPVQDFSNQVKSNILNRVHEAFARLSNDRRISSDDQARLEQHMDYVSDVQRSFASVQPPPAPSCQRPSDPGNTSDPLQYYRLYMELMAVAFRCGITKFGVMKFEGHDPRWLPNLNTGGQNFHDVMHGGGGSSLQLQAKTHWWRYFSNLIADHFLAPLEEMEGDTGRSYLENMVTVLMCSGGFANPGGDGGHNGLDSQQIIIGSMGGRLRSGQYFLAPRSQTGDNIYVGNNLPYNCFLITLLNLMGVPPSEYAFATPNGQGFGFYGAFRNTYSGRFYQPIYELLNS
jgi:hypothetical protein